MARRITKEYEKLSKSAPSWLQVSLPSESDFYTWKITMQGPDDSPYSKAKFEMIATLPQDYPFKHPVFKFITKIYHPNIKKDSGEMCDQWLKGLCFYFIFILVFNFYYLFIYFFSIFSSLVFFSLFLFNLILFLFQLLLFYYFIVFLLFI